MGFFLVAMIVPLVGWVVRVILGDVELSVNVTAELACRWVDAERFHKLGHAGFHTDKAFVDFVQCHASSVCTVTVIFTGSAG